MNIRSSIFLSVFKHPRMVTNKSNIILTPTNTSQYVPQINVHQSTTHTLNKQLQNWIIKLITFCQMAANITTEWFDLQVQHGNYMALDKEKTLYETNKEHQDKVAAETTPQKLLDKKSTQEIIDDMEDDPDFAEDEFSKQYMAKRMGDLKILASKQHYGEVREISRDEYIREVNEANPDSFVVLSLYQEYLEQSMLLNQILSQLAIKYPLVKFLKIVATKCIEDFPDTGVPMIICYKAGKLAFKMDGLDKHIKISSPTVQKWLMEHGIFSVNLESPEKEES